MCNLSSLGDHKVDLFLEEITDVRELHFDLKYFFNIILDRDDLDPREV